MQQMQQMQPVHGVEGEAMEVLGSPQAHLTLQDANAPVFEPQGGMMLSMQPGFLPPGVMQQGVMQQGVVFYGKYPPQGVVQYAQVPMQEVPMAYSAMVRERWRCEA